MKDIKKPQKKECEICGKKLIEQEMYKKEEIEGEMHYLCCNTCYVQFSIEIIKPFTFLSA